MNSPFQKRASEHLITSEAFLPLVSPAPLDYVLNDKSLTNLLDKLVFVLGTPGSGKTTFGRLFEFDSLMTLHNRGSHPSFKALSTSLTRFGVLNEHGPTVLAARITMDSEYREIWELPYESLFKRRLFLKLLQSRCVLLWCKALEDQGIKQDDVELHILDLSPGALDSIGTTLKRLKEIAVNVETEVYNVIHSLVPKKPEHIELALAPYDPLKYLKEIIIKLEGSSRPIALKPMLILDDAHELSAAQFDDVNEYLISRELNVSRWIMTRYDIAISANEWILNHSKDDRPGRQLGRDFQVLLTSQIDHPSQKRSFRSAALDIANRYLMEMPVFSKMQQTKLNVMLLEDCKGISSSSLEILKSNIDADIEKLRISEERVTKLREIVSEYSGAEDESEDVKLAMLRILLHRYSKRTPQQNLFAEIVDVEPKKELKADSGLMGGAKLHLHHQFGRPYYYGIEAVADGGSGNIEQFLRIADVLVNDLEAKLIRRKQNINLTAEEQHKIITTIASKEIDRWGYPMHREVRQIVSFIGEAALNASMTPNAYLDHGANAYGVLLNDFEKAVEKNRALSMALHYGVAYNALTISPGYHCKGEVWTLIQLGGFPIIKHGLPFTKGGFVEGGMQTLIDSVKWDQ